MRSGVSLAEDSNRKPYRKAHRKANIHKVVGTKMVGVHVSSESVSFDAYLFCVLGKNIYTHILVNEVHFFLFFLAFEISPIAQKVQCSPKLHCRWAGVFSFFFFTSSWASLMLLNTEILRYQAADWKSVMGHLYSSLKLSHFYQMNELTDSEWWSAIRLLLFNFPIPTLLNECSVSLGIKWNVECHWKKVVCLLCSEGESKGLNILSNRRRHAHWVSE